jgi:hypothetical protein
MSGFVRFVFAVLCVSLAIFCVFGLMAAPEVGSDAVGPNRLVYLVLCVAFVGVAIWLMKPIRAETRR